MDDSVTKSKKKCRKNNTVESMMPAFAARRMHLYQRIGASYRHCDQKPRPRFPVLYNWRLFSPPV